MNGTINFSDIIKNCDMEYKGKNLEDMSLQELDEFTSNLNNGAKKRFLIFLDLYNKYEKMRLENEITRLDTTENKG